MLWLTQVSCPGFPCQFEVVVRFEMVSWLAFGKWMPDGIEFHKSFLKKFRKGEIDFPPGKKRALKREKPENEKLNYPRWVGPHIR